MKFAMSEYEKLVVDKNHKYADFFRYDRRIGNLVNFSQNMRLPYHRWFYYKPGFSCNLVDFVMKRYFPQQSKIRMFDPFCGVGTVPLWAYENGHVGIGSDVSPLAVFISECKTIRDINAIETVRWTKEVIEDLEKYKAIDLEHVPYYFKKGFDEKNLQKILGILEKIGNIEDGSVRKIMLLALMKAAYDVSLTKKDGGFLRYIEKPLYCSIEQRLRYHINDMLLDFDKPIHSYANQTKKTSCVLPRFYLMDARNLTFDEAPFDLVVTSPPYMNRYDYTRIYAIEYGMLGHSDSDLKKLRKKTIKSHVEGNFEETPLMKSQIFDDAYKKLEKSKLTNIQIPEMVFGYYNDMTCSLRELKKFTRNESIVSFVVGNSRFSGIHFETDAIIAEIAENLGFKLKEIIVTKLRGSSAQQLHNYGDLQLRESLVSFSK